MYRSTANNLKKHTTKGTQTMKRYITTEKENIPELIEKINRQQNRSNYFFNISVKEYTGKKHDKENTATIIIG